MMRLWAKLTLRTLFGVGRFGFGFFDFAEEVAADRAVLPGAGVAVVVDEDTGGEGAEAGDGHVGEGDDGGVAGPFDFERHRNGRVLVAVFDAGLDEPHVAFGEFGSAGDGVLFGFWRAVFAAGNG